MSSIVTKKIFPIIAGDEIECVVDIHFYYAPDEYLHGYLFCSGEVEIEKIISTDPIDILDFDGNIKYTIDAGKDLIDMIDDDYIDQLECELMKIARKQR